MKRALILGPAIPLVAEILSAESDVVVGDSLTFDELAEALPTVHGIYAQGPATLDAKSIHAATTLEVVGAAGSGANNVDVRAATERGVAVVNAAGASYMAVAEHAIGLMISLSKKIAYYDRWFHTRKTYPENLYLATSLANRPSSENRPAVPAPHQLHGKTIGIVGFGFIGLDLAHKCQAAFAMRVLAYDPYCLTFEAARQGVELFRDLDTMLPQCDFVAITCPRNDETLDLMRAPHLRLMKPTANLIVQSRGGIVNEDDLVTALQQGWIAGAGIDSYYPEPARADHPFYDMDNVVLTPHIGGGTVEDFEQIARAVASQLLDALRGERPQHIINPQVWPFGGERGLVDG